MHKLISFATICYSLLIVIASLASIATTVLPSNIPESDKLAHLIAYFRFTIIWTIFFYTRNKTKMGLNHFYKAIIKASALGVSFGLLMEVAQLVFTDYRQFDFKDALANSLGVFIAVLIMYYGASFFMLIKKRMF